MPRFQPEEMLRALERHGVRYLIIGGLGATLHGSPLPTLDADICPASDHSNLEALARALTELKARIRATDAPDGLPFPCEASFLQQMKLLNLTTRFGDLDLAFEPAGVGGFEQLQGRAVHYELADDLIVAVAALEDIIRSKEAADRDKDRQALPVLWLLLQKRRHAGD